MKIKKIKSIAPDGIDKFPHKIPKEIWPISNIWIKKDIQGKRSVK